MLPSVRWDSAPSSASRARSNCSKPSGEIAATVDTRAPPDTKAVRARAPGGRSNMKRPQHWLCPRPLKASPPGPGTMECQRADRSRLSPARSLRKLHQRVHGRPTCTVVVVCVLVLVSRFALSLDVHGLLSLRRAFAIIAHGKERLHATPAPRGNRRHPWHRPIARAVLLGNLRVHVI